MISDIEVELARVFSVNIRQLREKKGWTQAELARQSKLTPAAINQLEKGRRGPTLNVTGKIANALDSEASTLFQATPDDASKAERFYRKFKMLGGLAEDDQQMILELVKKLRK